MDAWKYQFTVLTPTYNRAHTLQRVYASLCAQTFHDFEWVVVDDGSTDDTAALIQTWQHEAPFSVRYVWQSNKHKKAAFNRGVEHACGELIVAIDSDDSLSTDALDAMARVWAAIDPDRRHQYVAVTGLCADPDGHVVGDAYPHDVMDATSLDMTFQHSVRGEKFGCMRTEVLRKFPFPEDVPGFVPESLVWRAIARAGYTTRFVNQVFRVYYDSADSLSRQGRDQARHALGLTLLAQDTVVNCLPWMRYDPLEFLKAAARYTRFLLHVKHSGQALPSSYRLSGVWPRVLVAAMWPLGLVLYVRDRIRQVSSSSSSGTS